MVWQGTVNPPLFGASRFDSYHLHQVYVDQLTVIRAHKCLVASTFFLGAGVVQSVLIDPTVDRPI
jgi:hypothetical protein